MVQDVIRTEEMMSLSCSYCSAPLKQPGDGSEYVKCSSCGRIQKIIDGKVFFEQMMVRVMGFIGSAIPAGFDFSHVENADPIARHNIFVNNVKPKLTTEFREYRFNLFNLLSNPLMAMPFKCISVRVQNNSNQAFEFNAKNKSIALLAIDPESRTLVAEVDRYMTTYAYLLNNTKLMRENKPERYALMADNLRRSFNILKEDKDSRALASRLMGLSGMSSGIDHMLHGRNPEARESFHDSRELLESAKKDVIGNMNLSIMYQAIEKETAMLTTLEHMVRTAELDIRGDPLATMASFEKILGITCELESVRSTRWAPVFQDETRLEEIFRWIMTIRGAQKGTSSLSVVSGGGSVLFPFWLVDFNYSFKTGSLWMKKGMEVNEVMLVSAGFTTDEAILLNPSLALTDIFANFEGSRMMDSLTGKEATISNSMNLRSLPGAINFQNVSGRHVIPPLSTRKEVAMLLEDYVQGITQRNSSLADKLKLSAPQIRSLIFIPGDINEKGFSLSYNFGRLMPYSIGNLGRMVKTVI